MLCCFSWHVEGCFSGQRRSINLSSILEVNFSQIKEKFLRLSYLLNLKLRSRSKRVVHSQHSRKSIGCKNRQLEFFSMASIQIICILTQKQVSFALTVDLLYKQPIKRVVLDF